MTVHLVDTQEMLTAKYNHFLFALVQRNHFLKWDLELTELIPNGANRLMYSHYQKRGRTFDRAAFLDIASVSHTTDSAVLCQTKTNRTAVLFCTLTLTMLNKGKTSTSNFLPIRFLDSEC